jgi:hypothetical protein
MSQNKIINQGKIKKSEDEKAIFFSTNPYWERRERETKKEWIKLLRKKLQRK